MTAQRPIKSVNDAKVGRSTFAISTFLSKQTIWPAVRACSFRRGFYVQDDRIRGSTQINCLHSLMNMCVLRCRNCDVGWRFPLLHAATDRAKVGA